MRTYIAIFIHFEWLDVWSFTTFEWNGKPYMATKFVSRLGTCIMREIEYIQRQHVPRIVTRRTVTTCYSAAPQACVSSCILHRKPGKTPGHIASKNMATSWCSTRPPRMILLAMVGATIVYLMTLYVNAWNNVGSNLHWHIIDLYTITTKTL